MAHMVSGVPSGSLRRDRAKAIRFAAIALLGFGLAWSARAGNVRLDTSTVVLSSVNPSTVGQTVTFTAIVGVPAGAGTPTGVVQFFDDKTPLGNRITLVSGRASLSISTLAAGTHPITANYSGDVNFFPSTSPIFNQFVGLCAAPEAPVLAIAPSSASPGDVYTLRWNNTLAGQTGQYEVFLSTDGGATFHALSYTQTTSFSGVVNNVPGTVLAFYVRAEPFCSAGAASFSDPSNVVRLTVSGTGCTRPLPPNVTVDKTSVLSGGSYTLTWNATLPAGPGGGTAGVYRILQAVGTGAFTSIGTTSSTTFTGTAPDVGSATPVFLEVRAEPSCSSDPAVFSPPSTPARFDAIPGCGGLPVPTNITISSAQRAGAPTPTDFITVSWNISSATSLTRFGVRINGDPEAFVTGALSAVLPPRGTRLDPITAFVRAYGCSPESAGPVGQSDPVALQTVPPAANFTPPPEPRVGAPAVFTDTSSPQATNWLWIFDDGAIDTRQSPSHVFLTAGSHTVFLVASSGAGSTTKALAIVVLPASGATAAERRPSPVPSAFDASDPERRTARVRLPGAGSTWLHVVSRENVETVLFLRFIDAGGQVAAERRLSVSAGDEAIFDLGAYGLTGEYGIELVGAQRYDAHIMQSRRPDPKEVRR